MPSMLPKPTDVSACATTIDMQRTFFNSLLGPIRGKPKTADCTIANDLDVMEVFVNVMERRGQIFLQTC